MDEKTLLSGFAGAIIAVLLTKCIEGTVFCVRRRSLYRAIRAECQYNLGIAKQMRDGMLKSATFKRMSVEFFKEMRLLAVRYALDKTMLRNLSNLIIDLELFNREADCIFDSNVGTLIKSANVNLELRMTVIAASKGVSDSLTTVVDAVNTKLGEEDDDED